MFRASRGTVDVLPEDQKYWRYIERRAVDLCRRFGYQRIDTPVFENTGLFLRTVGDETDVVQKETYTFSDRGGDFLTLRPEGTAPVCRAYIERGMANLPQPVRLYYFCPIFRYERPQAGRYRQHHQFGIEAIGDNDPTVDAEVIQVAWMLSQELGLKDIKLLVNTIGDADCRLGYLKALKSYYAEHLGNICSDCNIRYQRNLLRLLDCKNDTCQPYIREAPHSVDHVCGVCKGHWESLKGHLNLLNIPFAIDHRLVRGLDYYTRTVFELQPIDEGGQSTLAGGGRYDGLIEQLGGRPTPGIGFGSGIERWIVNLKRQDVLVEDELPVLVVVACIGDTALGKGLELGDRLRKSGLSALLAPNKRSLRAQMRYASAVQAKFTLLLGEEEVSRGVVNIRHMEAGFQEEVSESGLTSYLKSKIS
jgi:histidyl-tRNA synthetase